MGMGSKQFQLYTTNLLTSPPEPRDLQRPPPEIRLPPNSCVSPSPNANADPSYLRSTINAIPTTSSLLSKSKLPLALIITPYRSLNEGEEPVHLVTDTVIARCRRCRTYINPYVQFIDGGNRYVFDTLYLSYFSHYLVDGDAACAIWPMKFLNSSIGIKCATNQAIDGHAQSLINLALNLWHRQSTWSARHNQLSTSSWLTLVIRPSNPVTCFASDDIFSMFAHCLVSGMVATATRTILENLDRIPDEDERTKIAIICYDVSLYFFSMPVCFLLDFLLLKFTLFRLGLLTPLCLLSPTSKMFFCLSLTTYLWTLPNHVPPWKLSWGELGRCSRTTA